MPFNRSIEVINSSLFKDLSIEDKKNLLELSFQNQDHLESSESRQIPVTFIFNMGLFAKLSLLLPALTASSNIRFPMILGLDQPISKILLEHLNLLKNFTPDPYQQKTKNRRYSCRASSISLPEKYEQMIKKIKLKSDDANNSFIASTIIKLLLCHPQAVFFLLSFGKGLVLDNHEQCRRSAIKLMEICKQLRIRGAYMITYINQPLGAALGSRLELKEVFETAEGKGPYDLLKLGIEISAELMSITDLFSDKNQAKCHIKQQIINGKTWNGLMRSWCLSSPAFFPLDFKSNQAANSIRSVHLFSQFSGFIQPFPAVKIVQLQDFFLKRPDLYGMIFNKKTGDKVVKKDILATIFFSKESNAKNILEKIGPLFHIKKFMPYFCPLIIERGCSD